MARFIYNLLLLTQLTHFVHLVHISGSRTNQLEDNNMYKEKEKKRLSSERTSDPSSYDTEAISHQAHDHTSLFANIPMGNPPDLASDIPGPPLSPAELNFKLPPNDFVQENSFPDPVEIAGMFEGDINAGPEELVQLTEHMKQQQNAHEFFSPRNAVKDQRNLWSGKTVPYLISSEFNWEERGIIGAAMNEFHSSTCIRFTPRIAHKDYIHIVKDKGCSSKVGRRGGVQSVSIGRGCQYVGIVMHELMHALGFWHEQSREDRDAYIIIQWHNIRNSMDYNFQKYDWSTVQNLSFKYDYGSLMHYGKNSFSKTEGLSTIEPRQPGVDIGQRRGFSTTDIGKLNSLYNCGSTPQPVTPPTPTNGKCEDVYHEKGRCKQWAAMGECKVNPNWMIPYCMKSCGACTENGQQVCADHNSACWEWYKIGECSNNPEYMLEYCKRSCGVCTSADTSVPSPVPCADDNLKCLEWSNAGDCDKNPAYMYAYCRKSCKIC